LLAIIGMFMMVFGWSKTPSLAELGWYDALDRLLIVHKQTSLVLFTYNFKYSTDLAESESKSSIPHELLTSGALRGLETILDEILASDGDINVIDHGDVKVIFHHQLFFSAILFTRGTSSEYNIRLEAFAQKFSSLHHDSLQHWNGDLSPFEDTSKIVEEVFKK